MKPDHPLKQKFIVRKKKTLEQQEKFKEFTKSEDAKKMVEEFMKNKKPVEIKKD